MSGMCVKLTGDRISGKSAEYIMNEHMDVWKKLGMVCFSTNLRLGHRSPQFDKLLLYLVEDNGMETAYLGRVIRPILYHKDPFVPGKNGSEWIDEFLLEAIKKYSPSSYCDIEATTWIMLKDIQKVGIAYMKKQISWVEGSNGNKLKLADVINRHSRTARAYFD